MAPHSSSPIRPRRFAAMRVGLLLGLILAAVVAFAAPASATSHHVTIASYAYAPTPLSITTGDTVTWTNTDSVGHDITVTSGPTTFQSPLLSKGQSWSYTFTAAGTYNYICSVHPDMKATVIVAPASAPPAAKAPIAAAQPSGQAKSMPMNVVTVPAHSPLRSKSAAAAPVSTTPATTVTTAPASSNPTLNPLLIVAGCAVGMVVFCLLLLASRPLRK